MRLNSQAIILYRLLSFSLSTSAEEKYGKGNDIRTVILQRGKKGFGFVLRGAKATSPLIERPLERSPALQYLDDVDPGGVADQAGLSKGDFLIRVKMFMIF